MTFKCSVETAKFMGGSSALTPLIAFWLNLPYSRVPTEWLEVFAESQVPHAKIMGCAKFDAVRAASH